MSESPDGLPELPDEFKALLNQVPPTMQGTIHVLTGLGASVAASKGKVPEFFEILRPLLMGLVAGIVMIENETERLQERPGFPWERFAALLSEFGRN
ncbi:hypothetical protein [Mycobacteroides abscessus]|uniref:hypothetical protein n=1 Tax=Mycobacteroides abscessus TaxID=36809 RepID=UPI0009269EDE|nr:hypothetical protein [Mycobacteroides abscessus]SIE20238.1 Uncharacterised protein [Mycobacteroides abscessus subsp. abscessus]